MAEVWAWFIFVLSSYFLVTRKWILQLIFSIVLAFSHPLVFMIFLLIAFCYSLVLITDFEKEKLWFLLKYWGGMIILILIAYYIFPEKIKTIGYLIKQSDLVGARDLKTIITEEGFLRIVTYLFSIIGIIFSLRNWKKDYIKYFLVLFTVSILLTQSYQWGVRFYVFRFYTYFEISVAFFAGYGLVKLVNLIFDRFKNTKNIILDILKYAMIFGFTFLMILPNIKANTAITNWQLTDYNVQAMIPPADLETIDWVKNNLPKKSRFLSETRWGAWLEPLSNSFVYENEEILKKDSKIVYKKSKELRVDYIFIGQWIDRPSVEQDSQYFKEIYNNQGSKIFKIN
jgi:hypothetical protein